MKIDKRFALIIALLVVFGMFERADALSPGEPFNAEHNGMYVDLSREEGYRYCLIHTYTYPTPIPHVQTFVMCGGHGQAGQVFVSGGADADREYLLYHLDATPALVPKVIYAFRARNVTPAGMDVTLGNVGNGGDVVYHLTRISGQEARAAPVELLPQPPRRGPINCPVFLPNCNG